jgi:hypothetical protein
MTEPVWEFECSVEVDAPPEFVWRFWTDIGNWRELEPGVEFEVDGPFAPGTRGTTRMPGQEPRHWLIRQVDSGHSWTQEMELSGASFFSHMRFDEVAGGRARITQRLWLQGENAAAFLDGVHLFEATTPEGMKRIAAFIGERAERDPHPHL